MTQSQISRAEKIKAATVRDELKTTRRQLERTVRVSLKALEESIKTRTPLDKEVNASCRDVLRAYITTSVTGRLPKDAQPDQGHGRVGRIVLRHTTLQKDGTPRTESNTPTADDNDERETGEGVSEDGQGEKRDENIIPIHNPSSSSDGVQKHRRNA